jgi:predicted DNA-binding ribbon-helix-helix protein
MAKDLKRSLTIAGHRTSISLEPEFWAALSARAKTEGKSMAVLVGEIDGEREDRNLSSAIRVYLLKQMQDQG